MEWIQFVCFVVNNQGMTILLNLFFGVVVNAAYGIAKQVNGSLKFLFDKYDQSIFTADI